MYSLILAAYWLLFNPSGFAERDVYESEKYSEATSFFPILTIGEDHDKMTLSAMLLQGVRLQCSEPLDRVFGFFGILRLSTKICPVTAYLAPDYTRSAADLYCDATRFCMGEDNRPWLLDQCGYQRSSDNTIQGLPTWVPNWFYRDRDLWSTDLQSTISNLPKHAELWSKEHRSTVTPLVPGPSVGKVLSIRGVVLETICHYTSALLTADVTEYIVFVFNAFQLLYNKAMPACKRSTGRERLYRLAHVLGAGRLDARVTLSLRECLRLEFPDMDFGTDNVQDLTTQSAERSIQNSMNDDPDGRSPTEQDLVYQSFRRGVKYCVGRKAFSTRSYRLGIGPKALQDGDVIVVSKLSQRPMVLRHAEDSGPDHYTVIGHAFVEGIHSGEEIFAAAAERQELGVIHLV